MTEPVRPDADGRQICGHCGAPVKAGEKWGSICPDCFAVGHRGPRCDEYCKPDETLRLIVAAWRARSEGKG